MKTEISKEAYNALQNTPVKTEILYFLVQNDTITPAIEEPRAAVAPVKMKRAKLTRTRLPSDQLTLKDGWAFRAKKLSTLEAHILAVMMPWLEEHATEHKLYTSGQYTNLLFSLNTRNLDKDACSQAVGRLMRDHHIIERIATPTSNTRW